MQTLLVGLDAASQFENFGYALGSLVDGRIEVDAHGLLRTRNGPNALKDVIEDVIAPRLRDAERALVAIDAPLGWPDALPPALARH
ncbi:hypothetical protein [Accumulibacter sp.]|uniref:hypothetical protein n=1 Tax=Accumulibacter sp. TaxID=2053492 RepID=UPI0025FC1963|nr:hypothetical protein [Accumulibacter sp.]MCM8612052.1 hypothetical protein [Accumulibacter sp.]MCM8635718.1 hypothetical protein [Accumulibacter sp.]MCM8641658.1 hypothetical protein [Accumulibacter sp.]